MSSLENKFPFSKTKIATTIAFLVFAPLSYAADIAGRVYFTSGSVSVTNSQNNQQRSVFKGDLVYSGERIETGSNSRIQIRMTDGGTIVLRPNSSFEIAKYSFSKDTPELGNVLFNFIKGGARAISGAIGKVNRENYKFNTSVATIGIRGTDYSVTLDESQKMLVTVSDGKINIQNDVGSGDAEEGETFVATKDSAPTLCHSTSSTSKAGDGSCEPVIIPLDGEESISLSKQKVKKPVLEDFSNYGAFAEAVRRYKYFEQNVYQVKDLSKSQLGTLPLAVQSTATLEITKEAYNKILEQLNQLDSAEMQQVSVNNGLGFQPEHPPTIISDISQKDPIIKRVFRYKLTEENSEEFKGLNADLLSIPLNITFAPSQNFSLFGNETNVVGLDIGTPEVVVNVSNDARQALSFDLYPGGRDRLWAKSLNLSPATLQMIDTNKNSMYRGISLRQALTHDNDGMIGSRNSGSIVIGNGSAEDATVVYTDDNKPISITVNTSNILSGVVINQQPSLVLKVDTPKLVIKTGDIYVSNSNSAAAGITKDGALNYGSNTVLGTNQDGATGVKIMENAEIILGEAKINAEIKLNRNQIINYLTEDGYAYNSSMSINVDAEIKDGLTINGLDLIDAGSEIRNGHLKIDSIRIADSGSTNLTANLSINVENFSRSSLDGLGLMINRIGDLDRGLDMTLDGVRLGHPEAPKIGDVELVGIKLNGTTLSVRGH